MSGFSGCRRLLLLAVFLVSTAAFGQSVDLRVSSISDSIDPVTLGTDDVQYTINVSNNGSSTATNPVLTINMPANADFVAASASNSGLCVGPSSGVLTCSWSGNFLGFNGRSASVLVTPTAGGTMTISATITSDQPDSAPANDTNSTTTTVNASIDLRVSSISDSIDPITLGTGNVTYTVNIINDSNSKATNPKVDITLPTGATYVSSTASNSGTCTGPVGNILTCNWAGDLFAFNGRSATVTVTPTSGGTMTTSATVSGDQPEADNTDNTVSHTTAVNASIDLRVSSISDSIDPITLGTGDVTYTVNIINDSTSKATNAKVDITIPAGVTFVSSTASNSGTCTGPVGNVVTCNWAGDLFAFNGRSATVTITPTAGGTLNVSATVSGDQPEADNTDNTVNHTTTVNASIDLRVSSISDSIDPITLGTGNVTYTVNIINDSTSKATNPKVDITLPTGSTFVSHSATSGTCTGPVGNIVTCTWAGDLFAFNGRSATVTVTPTSGGTMTLSATVSGDQPEADNTDNTVSQTTSVNASIDLRVSSVFDSIDPITLGTGDVTYTINIVNDSTSKATNAKVDITLPAGATYVSNTASNSGTCTGPVGNVLTCNWAGDLFAFNGRSATVTVTPTAGGTMTLSATVSGDQPEADNTDNTVNHTTTVNASIDLRVSSVTDSIDPITLGTGNVTYTINIINDSTSKATNAKVDITLPSGTTFVSHSASNSGTCTGPVANVVTCNWAGDLFAFNGRSATVTITPTAGGTLTTSATVSGDQPEADNTDNTLSTTTTVNASIDLRVSSIFDSIDPITLGTGNVTYTINIINDSTSKATNAKVDITIPTGSTFVSHTASNSGTCTGPVGNIVTCNWAGDLHAFNGRSATVTVTPTSGGTMTLSATVSGDQPEADNTDNTVSATTTVNASIDLRTSSITDSIDPITLGTGNVTYTVQIINDSTSKSTNPKVDITLPSGATYVSHTASNSGTCTGPVANVLTCNWSGDFPAFNGRTATVTVTPTAGGTMTASATVSGDQPEADASDNTASTTTTVNATIDLQLTVSDSPDPRVLGAGNVTYTVNITNGSTSKATNPVLTFTLPTPATYVSSTPNSGGTCSGPAGNVLTCNWTGDLPAFNGRQVQIVVTPTNVGQISATASVAGDQPDGTTSNNSETETTNINPSAPPTITSFAPTSGPIGQTVVITGSNFFSSTFVKFNNVNAAFTINSNTQITATVPSSASTGVITITNASGTTNSVSNFTVTPAPDLTISKTASAPSVPTSTQILYTIAVSNSGSGTAADVTVNDTLPAGVTLNSVSGSGWTCSGNPNITCTMGALVTGSAPNITIDVTAPSTGTTVTNTATVSTTTPETSNANNSSAVSVGVVGCPTTPPIFAPATVCANSTGHVATTPSVPSATYAWSITNGTITSSISSDTITFDAGPSGPVTLSVSVFVTSCPTATNSFNVAVSTPTATITPSGPTTFCSGDSVTLTANSGASYLWSNGATTQSINVNGTGSFTVTVTDAAGCSATSAPTNVAVLSPVLPTITPSGPTTFCAGGSVTLDAGSGYVSYLWSNGATTQTINVTNSETFTVTVNDGSCNITSNPLTVTVNPTPVVSITHSGPLTFCDGGSVMLDAGSGFNSYLWSNGATTQTINVTASETFTVTVTDTNGCSATSAPITVTVNPNPTVSISGPASACDSATLTADPGFVSYLWSNGATTQSTNVTATGSYTVTVTDANGCSTTSAPKLVTITSSPAPVISGPTSACDSATLDAGSGYATYLWNNGATTQTINVTTSGTYSVTVTDANGCSGTDTQVISIDSTPTANVTPSGPTTFCDGGSVTLTADPAASYLWSTGATTQSIVVSTAGTYTVTTSNGSCSAVSAPINITINALPTPTITGPTTACDSANLDAGAGYVSYLWSNGATTQIANVTTSGTYSVTVTDANGCSGTDTHTISIESTPSNAVTVSGPTTFCAGGSVTLTAVATAASYLWSNGATTQSITVGASGSYSVTVSNGTCSATSTPVAVTVNPLPAPTITGPANACDSATLDAGAGYVSYLWSNGATTQTINVAASGTYSVTVTDANGCSGTDSHTITISTAPNVTITPSGPTTLCDGGSVTLDAGAGFNSYLWSNGATTQSIVVTTAGSFSVTVTDGSGCSGTSAPVNVTVNPLPTPAITGPTSACDTATLDAGAGFVSYLWSNGATTQTINVTASGTYSVTVTDANGCSGSDSHTIAMNSTPVATITASATSFCTGGSVTLTANAGSSYLWSNGATTQSIVVTTSGTFTVTVTTGSCSATSSPVTINEVAAPVVAISGPADSCPGDAFTLSVPAAFTSYLWSNGATTPSITTNVPGTYTVTVTNAQGCTATDTHSVVAKSAPDANISAPDSALADSASNVASVPAFAGATYNWTLTNGTIVSGQSTNSIVFQVGSSGITTINIAITGNGCSASSSASVTIFTSEPECPTVPASLLTPANNALVSSPVTFEWSAVLGAIDYELWINGTLANTTAATSVTIPVPPGPATWHVVARLGNDCPPLVSAERAFTVQPPPDLCSSRGIAIPIAPANNSIVNMSMIEFRWQPVARNSGNRVLASTNGAPFVVLGTTTSDPSLVAHLEPGVIDWKVETLFDGCASTESQPFRFTIPPAQNCGTALPELLAPANGATTFDGNMTFQWTSVPNATAYEFYLALDSGTPTLIETTTATSFTYSVAPGSYQWFVRAIVERCPSRDSLPRTFTVAQRPACDTNQRPVQIEPLPGARITSPASFSWNATPNAIRYELFISHGNATPQLIASTTATELTNIELQNGAHRWFVRAFFANDCAPLDSAEQRFVIVPRPPACAPMIPPVISAPGQISSGVELLIQWSQVPGATGYELQLASTSDFASAETIATNETQHAVTRVNDGSEPLALFARVRASDARCVPAPVFSPFGPSSAFFILPPNAAEAGVPLTSNDVATFTVPIGAEFAGQTFTASVKEPWLSVSPTSGIVPAAGTTLTIEADTSLLGVGTHLGTLFLTFDTPSSGRGVSANATTFKLPTLSISKVTPVTPSPKSTPPPDALIIPAVAHANGINSQFQSDVRVTNSSAQLMQYQVTFTPTGSSGLAAGRQTTFSIDPGRTIALDDVLKGWFGTGGESVTGSLEVRPLTQTATSTPSDGFSGLANLVTFASSRTFNVTSNGTFGQYIPAIPFANFIGGATESAAATVLSLQQIAQSDRYRTNLGIVEGSGDSASLLVKVFGSNGQMLKEFPVNLAGGEHTQLNSFLSTNGVGALSDGRVEISVVGGSGKVTAYASVLDNATSDPLLVTPVTLSAAGASKWVVPGVADLNNGIANWQTDMRLFNAGTTNVDAALTFYSQNGGTPQVTNVTIPAGQVVQFDKALASVFGMTNDGGAIHIATSTPTRLVATARTYNQTSTGTYGQFISGITPNEAAGVGSRPLQILQVEESNRFRSNIGLAEVTGNPVTLQISIIPPDGKLNISTEVELKPNEFRQINSLLRSVGLSDTYNTRVSIRATSGTGRVTAYASVIDMLTNDPTYIPAQ